MYYKLVWSFTCHLPVVYREDWKAGRQESKWLASALSPEGHGNVNKEVSKGTTAPMDWDAFVWCLGWGKEGQECKVASAEKTPTDRNLSSQVCLSKSDGARDGKHEFCISQKWTYKRLFLLRTCLWLLIIRTFWHAALIWRLHSFISKWNFTALYVHFIWGTIYHPS